MFCGNGFINAVVGNDCFCYKIKCKKRKSLCRRVKSHYVFKKYTTSENDSEKLF